MNDRNDALPGSLLLRIARLVLDARDVERIAEPAVADLRFEHAASREPFARMAARAGGSLAVLAAIALALLASRADRARELSWRSFAPVLGAVVAGTLALRAMGLDGFAERQLVFTAAGAVVAMAIATSRAIVPSRPGLLIALSAGVAWTTAIFGQSAGGAHRWASVAGLRVQPIDLAKPFFVVALASLVTSGKTARALVLVMSFSLAAAIAGDPISVAVAACAGIAALFAGRSHLAAPAAAAVVAAGCGALALARRSPAPALDPHTDGILTTIHRHCGVAAALATVALLGLAATRAVVLAKTAPPARRVLATAAAAAVVAQIVAQPICSEGLALVSYGGSCIAATLALFALAANRGGEPTSC